MSNVSLGYLTIDNDGLAWRVCCPEDQAELDRYLTLSAAHAKGTGLTVRPSTEAEKAHYDRAYTAATAKGEQPSKLFAFGND